MARTKKAEDVLKPKDDPSASYNKFKKHEGKQYTGMKVGRSHKWYYDKGTWKERKVTPDEWDIHYEVVKRRAGRAPEGSGVPVDTEYKWFILAEQHVRKLNANDYTTEMHGLKYKIAHKRAGSEKWSATDAGQKKRMIRLLERVLDDLKKEDGVVGGDEVEHGVKEGEPKANMRTKRQAAVKKATKRAVRGTGTRKKQRSGAKTE